MKTILTLFILFGLSVPFSVSAKNGSDPDSLSTLQREVRNLFNRTGIDFPDIPEQDVTVGFMINAKNELIVCDVNGDSTTACDFVKQVISYQKVKYNQARQLTRYTIRIHLLGDHITMP